MTENSDRTHQFRASKAHFRGIHASFALIRSNSPQSTNYSLPTGIGLTHRKSAKGTGFPKNAPSLSRFRTRWGVLTHPEQLLIFQEYKHLFSFLLSRTVNKFVLYNKTHQCAFQFRPKTLPNRSWNDKSQPGTDLHAGFQNLLDFGSKVLKGILIYHKLYLKTS